MPTRTCRLATMSLLILMVALMPVRVMAGDWPIFRGPQHNGISLRATLGRGLGQLLTEGQMDQDSGHGILYGRGS